MSNQGSWSNAIIFIYPDLEKSSGFEGIRIRNNPDVLNLLTLIIANSCHQISAKIINQFSGDWPFNLPHIHII